MAFHQVRSINSWKPLDLGESGKLWDPFHRAFAESRPMGMESMWLHARILLQESPRTGKKYGKERIKDRRPDCDTDLWERDWATSGRGNPGLGWIWTWTDRRCPEWVELSKNRSKEEQIISENAAADDEDRISAAASSKRWVNAPRKVLRSWDWF